jgi:hypothetical protein
VTPPVLNEDRFKFSRRIRFAIGKMRQPILKSRKPGDQSHTIDVAKFVAEFKRKNQFTDLTLFLWGVVEQWVDFLFVDETRLSDNKDVKNLLKRMNFDLKLLYLKCSNAIENDEYLAVRRFQRLRNELFHKMSGGYYFPGFCVTHGTRFSPCKVGTWRLSLGGLMLLT